MSRQAASKGELKVNDGFLDTRVFNRYNIACAEVAQVVEQRTENPRVPSSILGLGTNSLWRRSGGMADAAVSKTVGG